MSKEQPPRRLSHKTQNKTHHLYLQTTHKPSCPLQAKMITV